MLKRKKVRGWIDRKGAPDPDRAASEKESLTKGVAKGISSLGFQRGAAEQKQSSFAKFASSPKNVRLGYYFLRCQAATAEQRTQLISFLSLSLSLSSAFTQQLFAAGGKALFEKAQEACVMSPSDVANIRAIMREQQKEDVEEDGEGGKQKMRTEVMQTILGG